jgi:hypothetical protein
VPRCEANVNDIRDVAWALCSLGITSIGIMATVPTHRRFGENVLRRAGIAFALLPIQRGSIVPQGDTMCAGASDVIDLETYEADLDFFVGKEKTTPGWWGPGKRTMDCQHEVCVAS